MLFASVLISGYQWISPGDGDFFSKGKVMNMERQGQADPEILKRIQEVEVTIERMTVEGMARAEQLVTRAREQADRLAKERTQEKDQAVRASLQEAVKAAEQEAAEIIEKAKRDALELKDRAVAKMEEAVDLVLERIFPGLSGSARS
jgi:vacuolar-type H+-ATPase subunit H